MNIASEYRIAGIVANHAMILPHNANRWPDGIFRRDRVAVVFSPDTAPVRPLVLAAGDGCRRPLLRRSGDAIADARWARACERDRGARGRAGRRPHGAAGCEHGQQSRPDHRAGGAPPPAHRLPASVFRGQRRAVHYGSDGADIFWRAASYVDRILKGAKPGDLPVQAPSKYELVINLKTARALGLEVPTTVLVRADE